MANGNGNRTVWTIVISLTTAFVLGGIALAYDQARCCDRVITNKEMIQENKKTISETTEALRRLDVMDEKFANLQVVIATISAQNDVAHGRIEKRLDAVREEILKAVSERRK